MKRIRVAVVGGGHLGQIHARLLKANSNVQLIAVCDPQPLVQQKVIQQFDLRAVGDARKILDEFDAAVIATPTTLHHEISRDLLIAGKHLLIEKPVTGTFAEGLDLLTLARTHGNVVQVGHVERFNPAIQNALGRIGTPRFIESQRLSGFTFRSTDIGVVQDLMIHDIDLVQWIFNGFPSEIRAVGLSVFGQNEDMAQARLEFPCGAVASLTASRCSYQPARRMNIFGTHGFASVDMTAGKVHVVEVPSWIRGREFDFFSLTAEQQAYIREQLFSEVLPKSELPIEPANAIDLEQRDWLQAIATGESPAVPLTSGVAAVRTAEAIREQAAAHGWLNKDPQMQGVFATPATRFDRQIDPLPAILQAPQRKVA
jgi:predicted dehydrogenase